MLTDVLYLYFVMFLKISERYFVYLKSYEHKRINERNVYCLNLQKNLSENLGNVM